MSLTTDQRRFAGELAQKTGLDLRTVLTWVNAENGPAGNPLNIGPGRDYGSWQAAVDATVNLLHQQGGGKTYAPILASAGSDVQAQLAAITVTPWDSTHYAGKTGHPGALLAGSYASLYGADSGGGISISGIIHDIGKAGLAGPAAVLGGPVAGAAVAADAAGGVVGDLFGSAGNAVSNIALAPVHDLENWAVKNFSRMLLYVIFTLAALGLILLGLTRSLGVSNSELAAATAGRGKSPIPF